MEARIVEEAVGRRSERQDVASGESAVLIGEEKTEWFDLDTGVRQGA